MKKFSTSQLLIFTAFALCLALLLYLNKPGRTDLALKIEQYESTADSLRKAVRDITTTVHLKDSILVAYLVSLDRTLEELNKESAKNRHAIMANFAKQDSIREAFCREMNSLDQQPSECK